MDKDNIRKLQERSEIYRACIESITDMNIFACDAEGNILVYNNASAVSDSMDRNEVVGKNLYDIYGRNGDTAIRQVLKTGEAVKDYESEYYAKGEKVRNIGSAYPIMSNGELIGAFSINRSHDDMKTLIARVAELQKQLMNRTPGKKNGTTYDFSNIYGVNEKLLKTVNTAKRAAKSKAPILIYGETGTGKEIFAQSIHNESGNANEMFVAINCAAIPETLIESILFGTVKGAFTGAENMPGVFEQAGDGTLFLDEINSMPASLQSKLLRVLQEKTYRRIGGKAELPVRCRIISACNQPLGECMDSGTIRRDLYYRLAVVCLDIPPLRERRDDCMLLFNKFLDEYARIYGVSHIEMSEELKEILSVYDWPGNVREMKHVVESAVLQMQPGEKLSSTHLPDMFLEFVKNHSNGEVHGNGRIKSTHTKITDVEPEITINLGAALDDYERGIISRVLAANKGNVSKTAADLGTSRTTLQYRIEKLGISYHR